MFLLLQCSRSCGALSASDPAQHSFVPPSPQFSHRETLSESQISNFPRLSHAISELHAVDNVVDSRKPTMRSLERLGCRWTIVSGFHLSIAVLLHIANARGSSDMHCRDGWDMAQLGV